MRIRGFSMAEVVFAFALIGLIAVTLLGVIPATLSATREAGHRATALRLADAHIELLARTSPALGVQPSLKSSLNGTEYLLESNIQAATPDVPISNQNNPNANTTSFSNIDPQQARVIEVKVSWTEHRKTRSQRVRRQIFARP